MTRLRVSGRRCFVIVEGVKFYVTTQPGKSAPSVRCE